MRGAGGTTSGRLFEAVLAWTTGVAAATVVASLRLVMVPDAKPDFGDVQATFVMIALAAVPLAFCVILPFAFRLRLPRQVFTRVRSRG